MDRKTPGISAGLLKSRSPEQLRRLPRRMDLLWKESIICDSGSAPEVLASQIISLLVPKKKIDTEGELPYNITLWQHVITGFRTFAGEPAYHGGCLLHDCPLAEFLGG